MSSLPPTTLGLRSRNDWISRLLRGRSWSCCSSRPREMAWLSSVMLLIASAVTVTVSFRLPTVSVTSTRAVPAARRTTPVLSNFLKFVRHDLDPVGPGSEVCRFVAALRIGLDRPGHAGRSRRRSSTAAPGTTLPWGSTTVPRMVPRNDCAAAGVVKV